MLYDKYQQAVARIASVIKFIKRFRVAIISIIATIVIGTWTGCAVNGLIYIVEDCPLSVVYGEALDFRAKAVFQDVVYEYAGKGIEGWTLEEPKAVGTYKVRAKSTRTFGDVNYSDEYVYTIDPKPIDITFANTEVTYGDKPILTADLVQGDQLTCEWEDGVISENKITFKTKTITITNKDGDDVTKDWYIAPEYVEQELDLLAREVYLTTESLEVVYDGQMYSTDEYTIAEGYSLAEDDVCVFTHDTASEVTEVNVKLSEDDQDWQPTLNQGTWTFTNKDGLDVTYLYNIHSTWGELVVNQRPITICTDSATFVWDGQGHTQESYTIKEQSELSAYGVVDGHTCAVEIDGVAVSVGDSENTVSSFLIYDAYGNDVTRNYAKTIELGTLTVNKRELYITVNDNSKVYNGIILENNGHSVDDLGDGLRDGDTLTAEYSDGIVNAGTAVCTLTNQTIYNVNDGDITENYEFIITDGTLTVHQRPLSVTTGDETFQYDGKEHIGQTYSVSGTEAMESGLIAGHVTEVVANGNTIKYVGESGMANQLAIAVKDGFGAIMTDNYAIDYHYDGVLTMTARPVLLQSASDTRIYNGRPLTNAGYSVKETAGYFALAQGDVLTVFDLPNGSLTTVGTINNAFVLDEDSLQVLDAKRKDVTDNYTFDTTEGVLTVTERAITIRTATNSWMYDGKYHYNIVDTKADDEVDNLNDGLGFGDAIEVLTYAQIRDVVWLSGYNSTVGSISNEQTVMIKNGEGDDVTHCYIIDMKSGTLAITPRYVTLLTGTKEWIYDDEDHFYTDETRLILDVDSSEGLADGHTLQILSRPTIRNVLWDGGVGSIVNEQQIQIVSPDDPNVEMNYILSKSFGRLTVTPRYVTLTTVDKSWIYDDEEHYDLAGTTLTATVGHDADGGLVAGQSWNITKAPTIRKVGSILNEQEIEIISAKGYGNVIANYVVEEKFGTLTITPRYITLTTGNGEWIYDDTVHENRYHTTIASTTGHVADGGLVAGQSWNITNAPTIREVVWVDGIVGGEVGSISNKQEIEIISANGHGNVIANYVIEKDFGTLKVTPRYVTLTTGSGEWIYDDTVHENRYNTTIASTTGHVADGGLVTGQTWNITNAPTIREVVWVDGIVGGEVGSISNEQEIEIISANGYGDVIDNYIVEEIFGTLKVTPRYITLTTGSGEWIYDDENHSNTADTTVLATADHVADGGLVAGQYYNITDVPFIREVVWVDGIVGGEAESISNKQPIEIISAYGYGDVIKNYVVEEIFGTLKVTPRYITLTTGSGEWIYDDENHSNTVDTTVTATVGHDADGGFAPGQDWYVIYTPSIREVVWVDGIVGGEAESISNQVAINIDSVYGYGSVIDNYIVEEIFGTLKVTPRYIALTTGSGEWIYDDTYHSNTADTTVLATAGHVADGGLVVGQYFNITNIPSLREVLWVDGIVGGAVESITNEQIIEIISVNGYGNVINNYVIEEIFGTLKITPRYITLTTGSGEWIYDDTDHSNTVDTTVTATAGYVDNGGLITGQTWNIAYAPTIREVLWVDGAVSGIENAQIIEIISAYGYGNVINNYVIEEIFGTLTITPRRVIVVTGSGVWEYDGAEHYNYDDTEYTEWVEGEEYGLLPGHALTIDSYATIVDIGSTENWHNISITADAGARNVKANYDVIYELGILTILDNEKPEDDGSIVGPGIPSGGGNLKEDGDLDGEFEGSTDGEGEEPAPLFSFVVGQDGMVYFRFKSFGDYEYNGWAEAEVYTSADLTVNPLQFVGLALQKAGYGMTTIAVTDIQGGTYWMLPYYAMDDNNNLNDVVIDKGTWDSYTMNMYLYDYFTGGTLSLAGTEYEAMEQAYRDFVYSQYVSLPKDTKAEMLKIIDKQGFSAASPTIIKDVANFISNYLPYDIKTKNYEGDRAVYFFTKAETALCRYYATAATAVYRALGIPARYVSGFAARGAAGEEVEVTAMDAHAWVEVYIDGLGWIPVEVTGRTSGDGSGGGITPGPGGPGGPGVPNDPHEELPIILRPLDVWDKYSYATTTLYATNQLDTTYIDQGYECLQAYLDQGYTYYVEVSGEQFGIGSSASTIVAFTLYNPEGVDVTDEFEFKFEEGTITLYGDFAVELISELRITYDGKTHSYHDFELIYQQMGEEFVWYEADVPHGYEITFNTEAIAIRDVDTLDVEKLREYMVITLNGVLVTDSNIYEGVYIVGKTMRIQRKVVEVTTGSYTAEYQEGIKVTNGSVWITKGSLAEGHKLVAVTNGLQTEVGYSENGLSVCKIVDADGNDVTDNYDIVAIYGKLEITDSK